MLVLGIETSCDETALALVEDGQKVLGTQVASSLPAHKKYGGVVPEIASRAHVELLTMECQTLLQRTGKGPADFHRIAVTHGPGLAGSLVAGVAFAKSLRLAWRKDLVGVNHLQAHLYAALMSPPTDGCEVDLDAPMIGLVISGGHTALVKMRGIRRYEPLGATRDDAVGEAFDKVAKILGLGFPGGPEIERVAEGGNPTAYRFTVPRIKSGSPYDFSLSGIKTAVLYKVQELTKKTGGALPAPLVADLAASFQHSIVEEVVGKAWAACRAFRIPRLLVGGGVVANRTLRERLKEVCLNFRIKPAIPQISLCTDNGAMVAGLGVHLVGGDPSLLAVVPDLKVELN